MRITPYIMDVKRVAVSGVIVQCWRELEVKIVPEIKSRAYLPCEQERICVRD